MYDFIGEDILKISWRYPLQKCPDQKGLCALKGYNKSVEYWTKAYLPIYLMPLARSRWRSVFYTFNSSITIFMLYFFLSRPNGFMCINILQQISKIELAKAYLPIYLLPSGPAALGEEVRCKFWVVPLWGSDCEEEVVGGGGGFRVFVI